MDPSKRPTTVQIRDALSQFQPFPPSVEEPPHSDDYRTVQTPGVHSLGSIFGVAREPIDEIAQVTQLLVSLSGSDRTSVLEACA